MQHRIVELRVIEQIEKLGAELNFVIFVERKVLRQINIPVVNAAALDDALPGISEAARRGVLNR